MKNSSSLHCWNFPDRLSEVITGPEFFPETSVKVRAASFMMTLSDGVKLFTIAAAPVGAAPDEKYPLVFIRSPYEPTEPPEWESFCRQYAHFLTRGYALVFQHCRGTGASEGEFYPYINERADGLEVLKQLRQLPFYNGEIFLWGLSYLASVHFSYLSAAPEDIKGAVLLVQSIIRPYMWRNGFLKVFTAQWQLQQYRKKSPIERNYTLDAFRGLPLSQLTTTVFGHKIPFDEMLKHEDPASPYWRTYAGCGEYPAALSNFKFPLLLVAGFYDIYTEEMFRMWRDLDEEHRSRSSMLVTPYDHPCSCQYRPGHHCFEFEEGSVADKWPDYLTRFFDHCRGKGEKPEFIEPGKITYYGLWEKKWYKASDLEEGEELFTLHLGERTLQKMPGKGSISYVYNPWAPAEFKGGCSYRMGGMQEQEKPDFRYDVVSFLSEPFSDSLKIRGKIKARIHAATDGEDTAIYLRLSIVKKDHTYCLREDITSICRQHPDYTPGETVPLDFSFIEHAFTVEKGDRLRLDVSSSCWPTFLPHTNMKGDRLTQTQARTARNTLFFEGSNITLPCKNTP